MLEVVRSGDAGTRRGPRRPLRRPSPWAGSWSYATERRSGAAAGAIPAAPTSPSSPRVVRQAESVGERLAGHHFAAVLVSPLLRARQTCDEAGFGPEAEVCDDLREWDYGELRGPDHRGDPGRQPRLVAVARRGPEGETLAQVAARADGVVARVRAVPGDLSGLRPRPHPAGRGGPVAGARPVADGRDVLARPGQGERARLGAGEPPVIERWNDNGGDPLG